MCVTSIVLIDCFISFFFFKQKTAYEMRISDWSSDVCSSDLHTAQTAGKPAVRAVLTALLRHIARRHHREHRQHLFEDARVDPGLRRGLSRHRAADILRAGNLTEHFTALVQRGRSEVRRVGKEWVSTCRTRVLQYQ